MREALPGSRSRPVLVRLCRGDAAALRRVAPAWVEVSGGSGF